MVDYANLALSVDNSVNTIKYKDIEIQVKQYLPIEDKIDLIDIALQNSMDANGVVNDLKLEMHFNLNIVYLYTDIVFTDEQRMDAAKLYNELQSSGLMTQIIAGINEDEYIELVSELNHIKDDRMKYSTTAAALVRSLINDLPAAAASANDIVQNFDPTKYQAVIDFATAANNGESILKFPTPAAPEKE